MKTLRLLIIGLAAAQLTGCTSYLTPDPNGLLSLDPAEAFSQCMEDAIKISPSSMTTSVSCHVNLGSYVLILHPQGQLTDDELTTAGVSAAILPELRALRIGDQPAIYVIANGPGVSGIGINRTIKSSRTTAQALFVRIDRLFFQAKTISQPVIVTITGPAGAKVIDRIE